MSLGIKKRLSVITAVILCLAFIFVCFSAISLSEERASAEVVQYTVSYNSNFPQEALSTSGNAPESRTVDENTQIAISTRNYLFAYGFLFSGWSENADGSGSIITEGTQITVTKDITYYAVWTDLNFVYFDANLPVGATMIGLAPEAQSYNTDINVSAAEFTHTMVVTGHQFIGWNTSADGKGTLYKTGDMYTSKTDATLYAVWKKPYIVEFYDFTGFRKISEQEFFEGESKALSNNTQTRTGYIFNSWAKMPALGGSSELKFSNMQNVDELILEKGTANTIRLRSEWKAISYIVQYNSNDGLGLMVPQQATYDTFLQLTGNSYSRAGYSFAGWATTSNGRVEYGDKANVRNLSAIENSVVTLYAVWESTYTVIYMPNSGLGAMDDQKCNKDKSFNLAANTFSKQGYGFGGWALSPTGTLMYTDQQLIESPLVDTNGGTLKIYAVWRAIQYIITLDTQGGIGAPATKAVTYDEGYFLGNPVREGFIFSGWYSHENGRGIKFTDGKGSSLRVWDSANDTKAFAFWQKNIFGIKGNVVDALNVSAKGALVNLKIGNVSIATTTTDIDGKFMLGEIANGEYILEVIYSEDGRSTSIQRSVVVENSTVDIKTVKLMPFNVTTNYSGYANIFVEGLEGIYLGEDNAISNDDKALIAAGGSLELMFRANSINKETYDDVNAVLAKLDKKAKRDGNIVSEYIKFDLSKATASNASSLKTIDAIGKIESTLRIVLPLSQDAYGKADYAVYRVVDGSADVLTMTPNLSGEYVSLSVDGKSLIINAKSFGEYAIAYDNGGAACYLHWILIGILIVYLILLILYFTVFKQNVLAGVLPLILFIIATVVCGILAVCIADIVLAIACGIIALSVITVMIIIKAAKYKSN